MVKGRTRRAGLDPDRSHYATFETCSYLVELYYTLYSWTVNREFSKRTVLPRHFAVGHTELSRKEERQSEETMQRQKIYVVRTKKFKCS